MKDITAADIQAMIAKKQKNLSAKSIRNVVATLRMMWPQAQAWNYAQHDPFIFVRALHGGRVHVQDNDPAIFNRA